MTDDLTDGTLYVCVPNIKLIWFIKVPELEENNKYSKINNKNVDVIMTSLHVCHIVHTHQVSWRSEWYDDDVTQILQLMSAYI